MRAAQDANGQDLPPAAWAATRPACCRWRQPQAGNAPLLLALVWLPCRLAACPQGRAGRAGRDGGTENTTRGAALPSPSTAVFWTRPCSPRQLGLLHAVPGCVAVLIVRPRMPLIQGLKNMVKKATRGWNAASLKVAHCAPPSRASSARPGWQPQAAKARCSFIPSPLLSCRPSRQCWPT